MTAGTIINTKRSARRYSLGAPLNASINKRISSTAITISAIRASVRFKETPPACDPADEEHYKLSQHRLQAHLNRGCARSSGERWNREGALLRSQGRQVLALSSHHELGRPNSGKILEGIFPSMGLKNRALRAPIFYPARAGWLAETCVRMVSEERPLTVPALTRASIFTFLIKR